MYFLDFILLNSNFRVSPLIQLATHFVWHHGHFLSSPVIHTFWHLDCGIRITVQSPHLRTLPIPNLSPWWSIQFFLRTIILVTSCAEGNLHILNDSFNLYIQTASINQRNYFRNNRLSRMHQGRSLGLDCLLAEPKTRPSI